MLSSFSSCVTLRLPPPWMLKWGCTWELWSKTNLISDRGNISDSSDRSDSSDSSDSSDKKIIF